MRRYRQLLAVVAVLLFSSGVDLYLFMADYTTVTPRDWVTLFGVLLFPLGLHLLYRQDVFDKQLKRMAIWSVVFIAISIVGYSAVPSDASVQELRDRLLAVFFLGLAAFAFSTVESRRAAGIAAIAVVLLTVVINAVEMTLPDTFVVQMTTRSSGLYLNANSCGAALVLGMIIGAPLVPRRLRVWFYLVTGIGIAMTFSRSTFLGWVIASAVMLGFESNRSGSRSLVIGTVFVGALSLVLLQGTAASSLVDGIVLDENQANRVSFLRTFEASDDAAEQRKDVAAKAWALFAASPIQGNGLASTVQWSEAISTHNMFLSLMADHGVAGIFILPALLMCAWLGRPRAAPGPHWAFCAFTLWFAFFSHNIFSERYQLLAFAFFVMGGTVDVPAVLGSIVRVAPVRPTPVDSLTSVAEAG